MDKFTADGGADRRARRRYKISLPMQFRVCGHWHVSRWAKTEVRDISSAGVSFRCVKPCPIGAYVELVIDWPARRNDSEPMSIEATGVVVRFHRGRAAVRFTSCELRLDREKADSAAATS